MTTEDAIDKANTLVAHGHFSFDHGYIVGKLLDYIEELERALHELQKKEVKKKRKV